MTAATAAPGPLAPSWAVAPPPPQSPATRLHDRQATTTCSRQLRFAHWARPASVTEPARGPHDHCRAPNPVSHPTRASPPPQQPHSRMHTPPSTLSQATCQRVCIRNHGPRATGRLELPQPRAPVADGCRGRRRRGCGRRHGRLVDPEAEPPAAAKARRGGRRGPGLCAWRRRCRRVRHGAVVQRGAAQAEPDPKAFERAPGAVAVGGRHAVRRAAVAIRMREGKVLVLCGGVGQMQPRS